MRNGGSHDLRVPSTEEISMKSIASGITHTPQEVVGSSSGRKTLERVQVFEEDCGESDGVRVGAVSGVVAIDRVGHVRPVVRTVQILSVPTHGEEDLSAKPVFARILGQPTPVVRFREGATIVVEADVADGLVSHAALIEGPARWITSDHAQSLWDWLPVGVSLVGSSISTSRKIVNGETRGWYQAVSPIGPPVVQI